MYNRLSVFLAVRHKILSLGPKAFVRTVGPCKVCARRRLAFNFMLVTITITTITLFTTVNTKITLTRVYTVPTANKVSSATTPLPKMYFHSGIY